MNVTDDFLVILIACAVLTYATRIGGYLVLARFRSIPPRLEAALDAVPAAVMTTLFAPVLFLGWREALTLSLAALLGLRFGLISIVTLGTLAIIALRAVG